MWACLHHVHCLYSSQLHAWNARQACYGHTEGAAGLTGALAAMCLACEREAPAVLCLREVNAHVCAALRDWAGATRLAPLLPRQSVPSMTMLPATEGHAGMSAQPESALPVYSCTVPASLQCQASRSHNAYAPGARHELLWHERRQRTHASLHLRS